MEVRVRVVSGDEGSPEPGTPVRVELRDVSLADAPSTVVASADAVVKEKTDGVIADTTIEVDDATWQRVATSSGSTTALVRASARLTRKSTS
jgi:uncharacterized lipoprotein YbaY